MYVFFLPFSSQHIIQNLSLFLPLSTPPNNSQTTTPTIPHHWLFFALNQPLNFILHHTTYHTFATPPNAPTTSSSTSPHNTPSNTPPTIPTNALSNTTYPAPTIQPSTLSITPRHPSHQPPHHLTQHPCACWF